MDYLIELGKNAKSAEMEMRFLSTADKNRALLAIADALVDNSKAIIEKNKLDLAYAVENNMPSGMQDRLMLDDKRILAIAEGVRQIAALPDPIGEIVGGGALQNGLQITKKRVPLGVIGIIYESRPNVTVDAAALCLKSGNVTILRGGSDAINTNICLVSLIQNVLVQSGLPLAAVQLVEDTSRETASALMKLNQYVDVLIPRGGGGLIRTVVQNATVPVIQTGEGVCHVYVDEYADILMAVSIVDNAKTGRPSVCNSIETVLVHSAVAKAFFTKLSEQWGDKVVVFGDEATAQYMSVQRIATDEDYAAEFNDYIIAAKVVDSIHEAARHIEQFGTRHSECIVTNDYQNAQYFQQAVDAAAVYVNASTRFTDGYEFGLGAEIGISNQKLHARGPMGLQELTTIKYLINGNGQIRG